MVKRPLTTYNKAKTAGQSFRDYSSHDGGLSLQFPQRGTVGYTLQFDSIRDRRSTQRLVTKDPEALAAMNDMDTFDQKQRKGSNRYPRQKLAAHYATDKVMREKIQKRAKITQKKIEENLMYGRKNMHHKFKSLRSSRAAETSKDSGLTAGAR